MRKIAKVLKESCVACGECTHACKRSAIRVDRGMNAVVDEEICVGCGICSRECPAGCISIVQREEVTNEE